MISTTLLTILGIIVTVIVGILGLLVGLRYIKKAKLTYVEIDEIPLFRKIAQNIDGLEVLFENQPVNPSIILLEASIFNNGKIDIDNTIIHKPVLIKLPVNSKWLRIKITDAPKNINLEYSIIGNDLLEFTWDLLKKNEFIKFDSLIEVSSSVKKISPSLTFSQRISNLDKVSKEILPSSSVLKRMKVNMIIGIVMFLLLSVWASNILRRAYVLVKRDIPFMEKLINEKIQMLKQKEGLTPKIKDDMERVLSKSKKDVDELQSDAYKFYFQTILLLLAILILLIVFSSREYPRFKKAKKFRELMKSG